MTKLIVIAQGASSPVERGTRNCSVITSATPIAASSAARPMRSIAELQHHEAGGRHEEVLHAPAGADFPAGHDDRGIRREDKGKRRNQFSEAVQPRDQREDPSGDDVDHLDGVGRGSGPEAENGENQAHQHAHQGVDVEDPDPARVTVGVVVVAGAVLRPHRRLTVRACRAIRPTWWGTAFPSHHVQSVTAESAYTQRGAEIVGPECPWPTALAAKG